MGIKRDELAELHDIAKTKKDGLWSKNGRPYIVKNGQLRFVGNFDEIYEVFGGFVSTSWKGESYKLRKTMKMLVKENG